MNGCISFMLKKIAARVSSDFFAAKKTLPSVDHQFLRGMISVVFQIQ